ncbi:MAG: hypothetical protein JNM56_10095 [Planctomycetia bacterium]|nr:hypothetical protein [Planctomycetia bacterium]
MLCCLLAPGCGARERPPASVTATPQPPSIRLGADEQAFEVVNLDAGQLSQFGKPGWPAERWPDVLAVRVGPEAPPMAGAWDVADGVLRFRPRFPLRPGMRYTVAYTAPGANAAPLVAEFALPKLETPPTIVEQVFPTSDLLPENHLKFYIHFSGPMSRGEAYEHLQILDGNGKPIESAFLELGEELWAPDGQRFTLFFDPGRIKHGLKPREDLGPVLEKGKRYTLVVGPGWHDAHGNTLKAGFRKTFQVGEPIEKLVDPKTWQLELPTVGGSDPLTLVLPMPHDHALLHRLVWVADEHGRKVAGKTTVTDQEKRWQFTPDKPWPAGKFTLVADTKLEDLAGNNLERQFEVDVFRPVEKEIKKDTIELPFVLQP